MILREAILDSLVDDGESGESGESIVQIIGYLNFLCIDFSGEDVGEDVIEMPDILITEEKPKIVYPKNFKASSLLKHS